jgi:CDP-alcohol phosphatidyltransferase-like enzyme
VESTAAGLNVQATYKSRDVEGLLDIHFYRKIGYRLAHFFARRNLTPIGVTLLGALTGVVAGHLFFYRDLGLNMLGMALYVLSNALDNADGQLARMTNRGSRDGRVIDGLGDFAVLFSIYFHLCLRCVVDGGSNWVWLLAIAAGASSSVQMAVADYLRNAYMYFGSDRSRGEFDSSTELEKEYAHLKWRHEPGRKFLLRVYLDYTVGQERYIPQMVTVRKAIESRTSEPWLTERYRRENKPIVKSANFFGRNTRMVLLFILLFLDQPIWYFIFEVTVFNVLLGFVLVWQKNVFDRLLDHLAKATS